MCSKSDAFLYPTNEIKCVYQLGNANKCYFLFWTFYSFILLLLFLSLLQSLFELKSRISPLIVYFLSLFFILFFFLNHVFIRSVSRSYVEKGVHKEHKVCLWIDLMRKVECRHVGFIEWVSDGIWYANLTCFNFS